MLLPKTDGGLRPIGLLATYIRVWMRCRRYNIATWRAANHRDYLFGGKGKGAQRAAWMQAVRAETAKLTKQTYGVALLDLVKAFEKIPHKHILAAAQKHGYCLWTLRLSLACYRLNRVISIDSAVSRPVQAVLGITLSLAMSFYSKD